ncbi:ComEC/Rec2 family competence protein [Microbacterium sp. Se63.02b]|uniref:ComEC/Rec2 family competence protein n=1 Tax=Microbacterium sp. Se63.02b TaxID=2709304 RepID=UPI001FCEB977|nr:ComEC/Rec2 family competence protein [Microbacterium sp. Se63.02b]
MKPRDLRLVPLVVVVWGVALLCVLVPTVAWGVVAAGLAGLVVLALFVRSRRGRSSVAAAGLALLLLAGGVGSALAVGIASPAREEAMSWDGRVVEVTADITSSASVGRDGRMWVEASTSAMGAPGHPTALSSAVRIGAPPMDGLDLGARLRVVGEAAVTEPGERSALVIFASETEIVVPASGVFGAAAALKRAFTERSSRLPEPGAGLLPGLAVGDTRAVSMELNDDMRTSGLSHLTAVSGANCAIVVGGIFWLVALCGGGRAMRALLALVGLGGFVILVTPEPSVIRAAVMAAVGMLSVLLGRPSAGAGLLSLCTVGILLADPWLAATPGFALSVAASGALILLARPLAGGLGRVMPRPVAMAVAVPVSAQLVCGPIIALFAEQQSLIGIAANLIAEPAAPIATVVGLLGCLAAPVPPLADLLVSSAWLPAAWIATTATTTARLPGAQLLLPAGVGSAALVALVSGAIAVVVIRLPATGRGPRAARGFAFVRRAGAAVVIVVLTVGGPHPSRRAAGDGDGARWLVDRGVRRRAG